MPVLPYSPSQNWHRPVDVLAVIPVFLSVPYQFSLIQKPGSVAASARKNALEERPYEIRQAPPASVSACTPAGSEHAPHLPKHGSEL